MCIILHSRDKYWRMNVAWRAIFALPLSAEERQALCLEVLRAYIGRMALLSAKSPNPSLRFFLAMLQLRNDLFPFVARDGYGQLVIMPLYRVVERWVAANWQGADAGVTDQCPLA